MQAMWLMGNMDNAGNAGNVGNTGNEVTLVMKVLISLHYPCYQVYHCCVASITQLSLLTSVLTLNLWHTKKKCVDITQQIPIQTKQKYIYIEIRKMNFIYYTIKS